MALHHAQPCLAGAHHGTLGHHSAIPCCAPPLPPHCCAVVINNLYDEIDDLEDELELAAEEAYLTEAALEEGGADDATGDGQTMAQLEGQGGK